ncbi:MAG: efflux RND transporter periplasmic adaptor subunit [Candidatus Pelagadaptatus aseana]
MQEPKRVIHGSVVPADLTRVAFRLDGKIDSLAVHSGDLVQQGQLLAELDDAIQQQALGDAEARYQLSYRQLQRAQGLKGAASIAEAQLDELKAAHKLAKANLELARNALTYTRVLAPFTGVVAEVHKERFESVRAGEAVLNLYRNDRIDVLVNLPDDMPGRLKPGQMRSNLRYEVAFAGFDQPYTMSYLKNSMARSPETQAFQYWLTMPAGKQDFPPGLPVTIDVDMAQLNVPTDQGVMVPTTALQAQSANQQTEQFVVWRYVDGVVDPVSVRVRQVTQQGVLIDSGLAPGDYIVRSGWEKLSPGQLVQVSGASPQITSTTDSETADSTESADTSDQEQ